jgi:hypothetical protein
MSSLRLHAFKLMHKRNGILIMILFLGLHKIMRATRHYKNTLKSLLVIIISYFQCINLLMSSKWTNKKKRGFYNLWVKCQQYLHVYSNTKWISEDGRRALQLLTSTQNKDHHKHNQQK